MIKASGNKNTQHRGIDCLVDCIHLIISRTEEPFHWELISRTVKSLVEPNKLCRFLKKEQERALSSADDTDRHVVLVPRDLTRGSTSRIVSSLI